MNDAPNTAQSAKNRKTAMTLAVVVVGMFGFGFALVPLYDLLCKATGVQSVKLRSQGNTVVVDNEGLIDRSRTVTVKFDASVEPSLAWDIDIARPSLKVHPGEIYEIRFTARNRSSRPVTGQAIPSIAPWQATQYFSKLDCFCFNQQHLAGDASEEMPLRFMVSPDLPKDIRSLTLSYSFLKLNRDQKASGLPAIAAVNSTQR